MNALSHGQSFPMPAPALADRPRPDLPDHPAPVDAYLRRLEREYFLEIARSFQGLLAERRRIREKMLALARRYRAEASPSRLVLYPKCRKGESLPRGIYWSRLMGGQGSRFRNPFAPSRKCWVRHARWGLEDPIVLRLKLDPSQRRIARSFDGEARRLSAEMLPVTFAIKSCRARLKAHGLHRAGEAYWCDPPRDLLPDGLPEEDARTLAHAWGFAVRFVRARMELVRVAETYTREPASRFLRMAFSRDSSHRHGRVLWVAGGGAIRLTKVTREELARLRVPCRERSAVMRHERARRKAVKRLRRISENHSRLTSGISRASSSEGRERS